MIKYRDEPNETLDKVEAFNREKLLKRIEGLQNLFNYSADVLKKYFYI
ncbi:hypothetical protein [Fonticella tunisiensis]|uniref:Uncharacterized protein n=1 Tax=Fonticella tunisiensis TaxID=1096341 RepID=A0A4R7KAR2_9CLOT|nr:hypothetical protein [Fonticella tunisiensis]TDT51954.1 hypothetical protein EDD71_11640 [Fonticella tunisiensis]